VPKSLCLSLFFCALAGQPALAGLAYNPKTLVFDGGGVTMLAWSPDGKYVGACAMGGACRVWDAASGNVLATAPGLGPGVQQTDGITFSRDGKALVLPDDGALLVWPWSAGTATHEVTFPPPYNSFKNFQGFRRCGPNGSLIESTGDDLHSWALTLDDQDFHVRHATPLPPFGIDPACLRSSLEMVFPGGGNDPGEVIGLADGHVIGKLLPQFAEQPAEPHMEITSVAAAPDGKLIAMGADIPSETELPDGSFISPKAPFGVRLLSWPGDKDIAGIFPGSTYVFTLSFSYDSRYLAAALDQQVGVVQISPPARPRALTAPSEGYSPVAFSPVKDILAVGGGEGVLLFDMTNVFQP